ncbi:hypothetical protein QYE76_038035 [Lolium multiflorum]|uniref:Reverse transcriptase zinc-binding domain-containing protein n=1 Tax=Lolium multiflorum TaxID=4521 RepID=A0AAD8T8U2_LOLMU|nr:hypothetical protein QYE76_038034 [Lolium multiflorum]KAK1677187.1 hypothetical protein QYE76_038035 [Lolium multiflorum]
MEMEDSETITGFTQKLTTLVGEIRSLGEKISDEDVIELRLLGDWHHMRKTSAGGVAAVVELMLVTRALEQKSHDGASGSGGSGAKKSGDRGKIGMKTGKQKKLRTSKSQRRKEGGFGIKDLHRQNRCLLLNFVHKLHQNDPLPWKDWFRQHSGQDLGDVTSAPSFIDKIVRECLPLYRAITRVSVVSGTSTAFWLDKWLPGMPLADRYPALFSHVTRPHASVATVILSGFSLQPRLSGAAERELRAVVTLVGSVALGDGQDLRCIDSPSAPPFSSREAYRMLSPRHGKDVSSCTSWGLLLPVKVRVFSYLADIDRLSTRSNLFFKNCAPSDVCAACPSTETGRHLFFDCSLASEVWARLGVSVPAGSFSFWDLPPPPGTATHIWHARVATILTTP